MAHPRRHEALVVAGILLAAFVAVFLIRRPGHWWGDDWALYVRQADSIVSGGVSQVIDDNRFTVERSGLPAFSPPMYPWGFALLLAPFVAVLGTDLDRLVIAQATFFCWFLAMWYLLARPRMNAKLAVGGLIVLAFSPQYLRWAELVQSEIAFLAVVLTALVVLDERRTRGSIVTAGTALWPLVVVGFAAAAAFTVRREGLAAIGAIGVAQITALVGWWRTRPPQVPLPGRDQVLSMVGRLATPFIAALAAITVSELLLRSTLVPGYAGNGLHNVLRFAPDHLRHVMESVGLNDVGAPGPTVLGSELIGSLAVAMFVALTVAGVILALRRTSSDRPASDWPMPDLPIAAFMVAALAIGGSFRAPGSRYVAVIGPIALLFALIALREVAHRLPRPRAAAGVALALVVLLAAGNVVRMIDLAAETRQFRADGQIVWGPDHPDSLEMFDAVVDRTDPDAVIGFFKARAMTQRTDRRAIQVDQVDQSHLLDRAADVLTHVVFENTPDTALLIATHPDPSRFAEQWSSPRFTLYHLTPSN